MNSDRRGWQKLSSYGARSMDSRLYCPQRQVRVLGARRLGAHGRLGTNGREAMKMKSILLLLLLAVPTLLLEACKEERQTSDLLTAIDKGQQRNSPDPSG